MASYHCSIVLSMAVMLSLSSIHICLAARNLL
ncbi:hypothetical protein CsSME_00051486 [Camellia sinensis var. sinensis]